MLARCLVRLVLTVVVAAVCAASLGCGSTTTTGNAGTAAIEQSSKVGEGLGSLSHAEDEQFCGSHHCIANFPNGHGEVVECGDGMWSHSGGITGACADHGGERGGSTTTGTTASAPTEGGSAGAATEGPGSFSHSGDAQFCASHECIANFSNGHGEVVQCKDGKWSHSGGLSRACSDHGGESTAAASAPSNGGSESSEPSGTSPVAALEQYWEDVRNHSFSEAYRWLAPTARTLSESQFVANERKSNIEDAQFHGEVTASSGASAEIAVILLVTRDTEFGCRTWNGSYSMVKESGNWRIERASISPQACAG